jgi:OHCU decarboxylase
LKTINTPATNSKFVSLNVLPSNEAKSELLKCCGSREWAGRLTASRPFASVDDLIVKADRIWWSLEPRDWLEAFHSHPKIGEKKAAAVTAAEAQKWSEDEQSGTCNSTAATMAALAELNREYEKKFGFIFIVCATGKSSEEMLAILRDRLNHGPDHELKLAAAEQAKITQLRLRKLIDNAES